MTVLFRDVHNDVNEKIEAGKYDLVNFTECPFDPKFPEPALGNFSLRHDPKKTTPVKYKNSRRMS